MVTSLTFMETKKETWYKFLWRICSIHVPRIGESSAKRKCLLLALKGTEASFTVAKSL